MLNRWSIKQKFIALALVVLLPLFYFLSTDIARSNAEIYTIEGEIEGLGLINATVDLVEQVQVHRGLMNTYLSGSPQVADKITNTEKKIEVLLKKANETFAASRYTHKENQSWKEFQTNWKPQWQSFQALHLNTSVITPQESFAKHTELVNFLIEGTAVQADVSALTYDPDENDNYLMDTAVIKTPSLIETFAKLRGLGSGILSRKKITEEERSKLVSFMDAIDTAERKYKHNLNVLKQFPEEFKEVNQDVEGLIGGSVDLRQLTKDNLLSPKVLSYDPKLFFDEASKSVKSGYTTYHQLSKVLESSLNTRLQTEKRQWRLYLGLSVVSFVFLLAFFFKIANNITRKAVLARQVMDDLVMGKVQELSINTKGHDEIDSIIASAAQLNRTILGLVNHVQATSHAHEQGHIDEKISTAELQGSYAELATGINKMVADHVDMNRKALAVVQAFGDGDLSQPLETFPGKKAYVNEAVEDVRNNIKRLVVDTQQLVDAAVAGRLEYRAQPDLHKGEFRNIVKGVNDTLDAVILPLQTAADYVDSLSKGTVPEAITTEY